MGRAVVALAADPDRLTRWSGQSPSGGQLARVCGSTDTDGSQPDCWRCLLDAERAPGPLDPGGYR